ncbi:MAG TPA: undecaprenyl-diphosphate phosphatase, partial [Tepidisphaeraceae bacterium]|nr:undecaprenyl-diphosphate phosphatase [Tepidisphaeraceae bacterium]
SLVLGVIEGLTEFLPVSSTAHLRIAESLLGVDLSSSYWKMYTVVIQLGAILSVLVYFARRIIKFVSTFPRGERGDRTFINHPLSLAILAFVVTAIPSFLLHKKIGDNLESLYIMGGSLLVGGIIMWVVDVVYTHPRTLQMEDMNIFQAMWIGLMQILSAVFPGTSRSMATIAAGQVVEMSRSAALEFSFFLSIPTMLAATSFELLKAVLPHGGSGGDTLAPVVMDSHGWVVLGIGFVVSFGVAWAVIAGFMHWVRRHGFVPFAVYRMVLGTYVIFLAWKAAQPA